VNLTTKNLKIHLKHSQPNSIAMLGSEGSGAPNLRISLGVNLEQAG